MDKQRKKSKILLRIGIIIVIVAVILGILMIINNIIAQDEKILYTQSENGIKTNVSKKLAEKKIIDGLEIYNIELIYKDKVSYLRAQVKNTNNEKSGDFNINIKLIDKEGQEIITIIGYIPTVEAGQTTDLDTAVTKDIAGAYNFEVSKLAK